MEGYKYREIAEKLGIAKGTVDKYIDRVKRKYDKQNDKSALVLIVKEEKLSKTLKI